MNFNSLTYMRELNVVLHSLAPQNGKCGFREPGIQLNVHPHNVLNKVALLTEDVWKLLKE